MWTVLYDDRCRVCRSFAERMARKLGPEKAQWVGRSASSCLAPSLHARAANEMVAVSPSGTVYGGIDAVAEILALSGCRPARLLRLPVIATIARACYRAFARNRGRLGLLCPECGPVERRE